MCLDKQFHPAQRKAEQGAKVTREMGTELRAGNRKVSHRGRDTGAGQEGGLRPGHLEMGCRASLEGGIKLQQRGEAQHQEEQNRMGGLGPGGSHAGGGSGSQGPEATPGRQVQTLTLHFRKTTSSPPRRKRRKTWRQGAQLPGSPRSPARGPGEWAGQL